MNIYDYNPDHFKPLNRIVEADPRASFSQIFDQKLRQFRDITLEDHYREISRYTLPPSVPERVITHFETAKNLCLYAWYVHRFYAVAELHAKITLEFALKKRIGEANLKAACKSVDTGKGLKGYILYAINQGWVTNEGFERWWQRVRFRARHRVMDDGIKEMRRRGLESFDIDEDNIEITEEDKDFDLVNALAESIPALRNEYAHGSHVLFGKAFGTLEIVYEFISQLWPEVEGV